MFAVVVARVRTLLAIAVLAFTILPSLALAQLRTRETIALVVPGPTGVTAAWTSRGPQLSWQPVSVAVEYVVVRGPAGGTPTNPIGRVRADVFSYVDSLDALAAAYQIVAVDGRGRTGASAIVQYSPPVRMVTGTLSTRPISTISTLSSTSTTTSTAPALTSYTGVYAPDTIVYVGDTVRVRGTGLDGLTSVTVVGATRVSSGYPWYANSAATPISITPLNASASGFSFVGNLPISGYANQLSPYVIIVTKSAGIDTSNFAVHVGPRPVVRKITSVAQTNIRSGARVKITGTGFSEVIGGYFGVSTPGSTTNPMLSVANRSDTYVELMTTPDCKQEGILMLHHPVTGGTPLYITGDNVIRVACYPGTPEGKIDGDVNGVVYISDGNTDVAIRGTNLKAVTNVVDQMGRKYPVTYQSVGTTEWVRFKVGTNFTPGGALGLTLENFLTEPVVNGTVTGSVRMLAPATWTWLGPAWAEPGMKVRISGHNLKNAAMPTVTVGGIPAQVLTADALNVEFRVPTNATAGPVALTNEAGTVTMSGQFSASNGQTHPGFFIVAGPTTVTSITLPRNPIQPGDEFIVQGQNLARAMGICVVPPGGQPLTLQRVQTAGGIGFNTSNTEMKVISYLQPSQLPSGSAIQVYRPTSPPGDFLASDYACHPQTGPAVWP